MDFKIELSRKAEIEFNIIDCYFSGLGISQKFYEDFHSQILLIQSNPFLFQTRYKNIRIVHLNHFNYSIHYNIENNVITILRILGQAQQY